MEGVRAHADCAVGQVAEHASCVFAGNDSLDPKVVVTAQSEPKDTQVPAGTTIRLTFADTKAAD